MPSVPSLDRWVFDPRDLKTELTKQEDETNLQYFVSLLLVAGPFVALGSLVAGVLAAFSLGFGIQDTLLNTTMNFGPFGEIPVVPWFILFTAFLGFPLAFGAKIVPPSKEVLTDNAMSIVLLNFIALAVVAFTGAFPAFGLFFSAAGSASLLYVIMMGIDTVTKNTPTERR